MLSTGIGDKKKEILEMTKEERKMEDDDTCKNNLHGLFFKSESEHASAIN